MAEADYFEGHPIQAAVLVVSYIHANHHESGPYQFDEFLNKYETIFEYPDENNAADEVGNYIDELSSIVEQYIKIEIQNDDIILLVGANNVGKSRTLKDLNDDLNESSRSKVVVNKVEYKTSNFAGSQLKD